MAEQDWEAEAAHQLTGKKKKEGVRQAVNADGAQFNKLNDELKVLKKTVQSIRDEIKGLASDANSAMGAVSGMAGAAGGKTTTAAGNARPTTTGTNTSFKTAPASKGHVPGGGAGINTGGNFGGFRGYMSQINNPAVQSRLIGGYIGGQVAGQIVGGVDARIDRGAQYAMGADRLNVALQQQTGLSQMGVMNGMRAPLTKYRLGAGGINEMLKFQMETGATVNGGSVEALRTLSGYSKSTGAIMQDQRANMQAETANRMFMTLGTSAYTIGGGVNDPLKMRQQIVKRMGLDSMSREQLDRGKMDGSVLRGRMQDAGLNEQLQQEVFDYSKSQITYREKGGKGNYDPTKKSHRKLMGIEENFATQTEETDRLRAEREEDFSKRQLDNLASMEKNTQDMVKLMGSIEDKLSGLIGARASSRGWQRLLGTGLQVGGAALAVGSGGTLAGVGAGMMIGGSALSASGDPTEGNEGVTGGSGTTPSMGSGQDGNIKVPYGYGGSQVSLTELKGKGTFSGMNPRMRDRLLAMMRASGGRVGIGGGLRDSSVQEAMFRDRYRVTSKDTGVKWQGKNWERVKGAPAAPPGRSMHEIGLAADLVGDLDWVQANAARFGLKTFAGVNNEPWHVQPAELPNSRRKYEEGGAQWGSDGGYDDNAAFQGEGKPVTGGSEDLTAEHAGYGPGGAGMRSLAGLSINEIMTAMDEDAQGRLMLTGGGPGGGSGGTSPTSQALAGGLAAAGNGPGAAAAAAYNAGFRGEDLFKIVSIAGRESGFDPTAINQSSNDTGMWQIAPMNWGQFSQQQLLDPNNNAKIAFELYKSSGFHGWKAANSRKKNSKGQWIVDESGKGGAGWAMNGNELWHTEKFQEQARAAIGSLAQNSSGDPMPMERDYGSAPGTARMQNSQPVTISKPMTINVNPTINFTGSPQTADLSNIARQVTAMIEQGARELEMRDA